MSSQVLLGLLDKIKDKDPDHRYMATSDLATELQKDSFRVDPDTERKLCTAMIAQLDDTSGDISSLAVRCLGILIRKVGEPRAVDLVTQLSDKAITGATKKETPQRDVASVALKTIMADVQGCAAASTLAQAIARKMLQGMAKDNVDIVNDSIDVLCEVAEKAGAHITSEHVNLRDALIPFLDDSRATVRKRALQCLAGICPFLNDDLLANTITVLLDRLKTGGLKPDFVRTYVHALGNISRLTGYRFGRHISDAVPLIITYCGRAGDGDDELREQCLQTLESFVGHVSIETRVLLEPILKLALANLKHDPNFADDDMEEDENGEEDADYDDEPDSDEGYSDDEDISWKVRRAAVKLLAAIFYAYPDALTALYEAAAGELVVRFKEREESVRCDVFHAYAALVKQVGVVSKRYAPDDPASPIHRLATDVPNVILAVGRKLRERSSKTRVAGFQLLKELVHVVPAAVAAQLGQTVPGIVAALNDKSNTGSALKIEALAFTRVVLASGPQGAAADVKQLQQLLSAVLPCANDRYYKVAAEAIKVLEQVFMVGRPDTGAPANLSALRLPEVFKVLQTRLSAPDQDQEVKEAAISATATAAARCADIFAAELPAVLRILLERLRNEITRMAAVRAFTIISESPLPLDLSGPAILDTLVLELTSFLKKALRPLRLASLQALEGVSRKYGLQLSTPLMASMMEEVATLITEVDLALAAQALRTLSMLLKTQPSSAPIAVAKALPTAMNLVRSPLLQGAALDQLKTFLTALAATRQPGASVDELLLALLNAGKAVGGGVRGGPLAVSQCVAVLASSAGHAKVLETAKSLLGDVTGRDALSQRLALLCLGELGRRSDLSSAPQVEAAIRGSLTSDSEEVKGAASIALGGVTCGNLDQYVPALLRQIKEASSPKLQYILLGSLNEVLTTMSIPPVAHYPGAPVPEPLKMAAADQAASLSLLLGLADNSPEECKLVVSECLGRQALQQPDKVLAELRQRLSDPSVSTRAVVVSTLKFMVLDRPHAIDEPLAAAVGPFLSLMSDPNHNVRRAAVVSLSAIAHQKPALVAAARDGAPIPLVALLPLLYEQTVVREELIRTVDLGPFKHKIDDGLELRKAAFEALDILLDSPSCSSLLDIPTFLKYLQSGLGDHVDIKAPCHLMLSKLAATSPVAVLAGAESLVDPLEKTLTTRLKSDAVKQEIDRHEDMLRSCLRAVHSVAVLPGVETCTPFQNFMKRVVLVGPIKDKYAAVVKDWTDANIDHMDIA